MKMVIALLAFLALSCGQSNPQKNSAIEEEPVITDSISYDVLGKIENGQLLIEQDVDLKGCICQLPQDITLCTKGGKLRNGKIIGNNTRIGGGKTIFDKVTIGGSWNVPMISTTLFADLDYENSLRDVVALASPEAHNKIIIEKGEYKVRARKNGDVCVQLCSNTDFVLNGTIQIAPNGFKNYYILRATGKNINISGKGTIIGDKPNHTGTEGEWGMGIDIRGAVNTYVNGLTIKDCWGDCIYVGGRSQNVLIENCKLNNGRRQGISVTKADTVIIRKCRITNVSGTNPQFAIDIEPNRPDSVDNILIEDVTVRNCEGGFLVVHGEPIEGSLTPWIGSVTIRNCDVKCKNKYPVRVVRCEKVRLEKCTLYAPDGLSAITIDNSIEAIVQNNNISVHYDLIDRAKNELRELVGRGRKYPIDIRQTDRRLIKNNKILSER